MLILVTSRDNLPVLLSIILTPMFIAALKLEIYSRSTSKKLFIKELDL